MALLKDSPFSWLFWSLVVKLHNSGRLCILSVELCPGAPQTKCTRSYNTPVLAQAAKWTASYCPKLVWMSAKTVTLMLPDGAEHRFNC